MKYYFDNRYFCETFVDITVDEEYLDTIYIKYGEILSINLQDNVKQVAFSFHRTYRENKVVMVKHEDNVPLEGYTEVINETYKSTVPQFRFPYDLVINTEVNKEDLILYPATLHISGKETVLIYKAIGIISKKSDGIELIKNKNLNISSYRNKGIKSGIMFVVLGIILCCFSILNFMKTNLSIKKHYALFGLTGGVLLIIVGLISIWNHYKYIDYYNEDILTHKITSE